MRVLRKLTGRLLRVDVDAVACPQGCDRGALRGGAVCPRCAGSGVFFRVAPRRSA